MRPKPVRFFPHFATLLIPVVVEHEQNELNREVNAKEKEIGLIYKQKKENAQEEAKSLKEQVEAAKEKLKDVKPALALKKAELAKKLNLVGNIVHESVPVSKDEVKFVVLAHSQFTNLLDLRPITPLLLNGENSSGLKTPGITMNCCG